MRERIAKIKEGLKRCLLEHSHIEKEGSDYVLTDEKAEELGIPEHVQREFNNIEPDKFTNIAQYISKNVGGLWPQFKQFLAIKFSKDNSSTIGLTIKMAEESGVLSPKQLSAYKEVSSKDIYNPELLSCFKSATSITGGKDQNIADDVVPSSGAIAERGLVNGGNGGKNTAVR